MPTSSPCFGLSITIITIKCSMARVHHMSNLWSIKYTTLPDLILCHMILHTQKSTLFQVIKLLSKHQLDLVELTNPAKSICIIPSSCMHVQYQYQYPSRIRPDRRIVSQHIHYVTLVSPISLAEIHLFLPRGLSRQILRVLTWEDWCLF